MLVFLPGSVRTRPEDGRRPGVPLGDEPPLPRVGGFFAKDATSRGDIVPRSAAYAPVVSSEPTACMNSCRDPTSRRLCRCIPCACLPTSTARPRHRIRYPLHVGPHTGDPGGELAMAALASEANVSDSVPDTSGDASEATSGSAYSREADIGPFTIKPPRRISVLTTTAPGSIAACTARISCPNAVVNASIPPRVAGRRKRIIRAVAWGGMASLTYHPGGGLRTSGRWTQSAVDVSP